MTVQELIDKLSRIDDKSTIVYSIKGMGEAKEIQDVLGYQDGFVMTYHKSRW